ncbi:hypothetical protein BKP45_06355 [Anaerobacillus alkalidiazotrophicus]|uniref:Uncharacterized protein n=1 Tax=Anaerobacillus alkalidiazotrophicus TaxID=472963 RepID=A0A1S2MCC9_9BACI|nr:hypothetical protein [Anaerobacillus alkalidiazotrophicus]OIJ22260.1 hypothetical protein BKP45_06355 [Anaerobacillus alkalidiazotrophicus]
MEQAREDGGLGGDRGRIQRQPILIEMAEELLNYPEVIGYNLSSSTSANSTDFEQKFAPNPD